MKTTLATICVICTVFAIPPIASFATASDSGESFSVTTQDVGREPDALAVQVVGGRNVAARDDGERLLNDGLSFLHKHIAKHGGFMPFALVLRDDGKPAQMSVAYAGENATSAELLVLLREQVRAEAADDESVKGVAVFVDSLVRKSAADKPVDAIRAAIDHRSGYCVNVYVPYTRNKRGEVTLGQSFATEGEWFFFDGAR